MVPQRLICHEGVLLERGVSLLSQISANFHAPPLGDTSTGKRVDGPLSNKPADHACTASTTTYEGRRQVAAISVITPAWRYRLGVKENR
jgi:hypothetical protein